MIWKKNTDLAQINKSLENTMADYLDIKITNIADSYLTATMPVNQKTKQPFGILHGGASVVLAETIGSLASNLCLSEDYYSVGLDINANHIKTVANKQVIGTTKALHLGRSTHLWEIKITDQEGQLISISKLTTYTRIKKK